MSESAIRVQLFGDEASLDPYLDAWDVLACELGNPFLSPDWMMAWWRHVAPEGALLRVAIAEEGSRVIAIAPFWLDRRISGRRLRVLGSGVSSSVDLLAHPDNVMKAAPAIAMALASSQPIPTALEFSGVASQSDWPHAMVKAWPSSRPPKVFLEVRMPAPFLSFTEETFGEWFECRSSHFRARMRRGSRKLESLGGELRPATATTMQNDLEWFFSLHHDRWRDRGGSGVLTPGVERMLRELAQLRSPVLRIWCVDDAVGRPASVQVFLSKGGTLSYWLGGFSDSLDGLRPGPAILTVLRVIEQGFADGDRILDLGSGDQHYKYEFTDQQVELQWITVVPPSLLGAIQRWSTAPLRLRIALARRMPRGLKRAISRRSGWLARLVHRSRR